MSVHVPGSSSPVTPPETQPKPNENMKKCDTKPEGTVPKPDAPIV